MPRSDREYLEHILVEARYLQARSQDLAAQSFRQDKILKRPLAGSLEITGEVAKQVSETTRQRHPRIPWRTMAGMRNRLIHRYFGVDNDIIWDVVINEVPGLTSSIGSLLDAWSKA